MSIALKIWKRFWFFWKERTFLALFISLVLVSVFGLLLLVAGYLAVTQGVFGKMPSDHELKEIKNYEASVVYSSDSVLLGRYYVENRTEVKYENVSPNIINALIATEDARFYEHQGIDQRSMIRVLFKTVILGQNAGGGSTLSQQLVKNLFGRQSYGMLTVPVNKTREAIIANRLEHLYSKKEILMLYLNTVSFGEDTYGIETACRRFFSTNTKDISAEQAAVLIGMLKAPTSYNPRTKPEESLLRRNTVLTQMVKYGYLEPNAFDSLRNLPLELAYNRMGNQEGSASHFRQYLKKHLDSWMGQLNEGRIKPYNLYTDGLKIYTTIHSSLQSYAEQSVVEHLSTLNPLLQSDLKTSRFFDKNMNLLTQGVKQSVRYARLVKEGVSEQEALKKLSQPIPTALFTDYGLQDTLVSAFDSVRHSLGRLQAGFLVVEPANGNILAWVGGPSYQEVQFDHVLSYRQVGSVFKPVVYAQALLDGYAPCDFVSNQKVVYTQYDDWAPQNSNGQYEGNYSLLGALTKSINTVSVKLCMESGISRVIDLAYAMGIEGELPMVPSVALGAGSTSLKNLVAAYTALANRGVKTDLQFIASIKDKHGMELYAQQPVSKKVLPGHVASDITSMLQSVVDRGTAARIRHQYHISGAVAGKTGTTQEHTDGWFMGYTPRWLGGVWVGADNPTVHFSGIANGQGASTALPIWALFYKKIEKDPTLKHLLEGGFDGSSDPECDLYREDSGLVKFFRKKQKKNRSTGLGEDDENTGKERRKKKRLKEWFKGIFDRN